MNNTSEYKCPSCQHSFPMNDIDQEKNIALCANCGASSTASDLINEEQNDHILATPPKNLVVEKTAQSIAMSYRERGIFAFISSIMALFWTGIVWGIMIPVFAMQDAPPLILCMTVIVFVLLDLLLLSFAIFLMFGKSVISVTPGKGTFFCGIGFLSVSRSFELTSQTQIGEKSIGYSRTSSIGAITISNPGKKQIDLIHFFRVHAFPCIALPYIKSVLNQLKN